MSWHCWASGDFQINYNGLYLQPNRKQMNGVCVNKESFLRLSDKQTIAVSKLAKIELEI